MVVFMTHITIFTGAADVVDFTRSGIQPHAKLDPRLTEEPIAWR
jgi:hypothetical protein